MKKDKTKHKFEFSKIVIALLMLTYFVILILGIFVVMKILDKYPDYSVQALTALFSYVGAPISIVTPFYLNKAKWENIHKNPNIENVNNSKQQDINDISTDDVVQPNISDK
jgi:uncharacterized ion transporter superfamily protein YfcC